MRRRETGAGQNNENKEKMDTRMFQPDGYKKKSLVLSAALEN